MTHKLKPSSRSLVFRWRSLSFCLHYYNTQKQKCGDKCVLMLVVSDGCKVDMTLGKWGVMYCLSTPLLGWALDVCKVESTHLD